MKDRVTSFMLIKKIMIVLLYIIIFAPYIFNIFHSMPANDDFALSLNWWGKSIIGEAFMRAGWNYMNWFGQSGIIAILIQVLFNPLYWFNNAGYSMGICMLIVNAIVIVFILKSVHDIFNSLIDFEKDYLADVCTMLIAIIITSANYYADVYNWWAGCIGYAVMMMFAVLSISNTVKYHTNHLMKNYVGQIICGVIACTSLMCCVPVGLMYLVISLYSWNENPDSKFKKILPIMLYVISGIITAIAPGNFTRKIEGEGTTVASAIKVSVYVVIKRLIGTFIGKPWMLILLAVLILIGFNCVNKRKYKFGHIIVLFVGIILSAIGSILPYVYGQAKKINTEFAPRAYYMMDYVLFIGTGIVAVLLGTYIKDICTLKTRKILSYCISCFCLVVMIYVSVTGIIMQSIQLDIIAKKEIITDSYMVWNDILDEIDESEPGSDVVITRPQLTWCQYVYYPGINEEVCEPIKPEDGYANCNQSAAKHFGVNRVSVIFE